MVGAGEIGVMIATSLAVTFLGASGREISRPGFFEGRARSRLLRLGDSFMRSPEECAREPGAWIVRGLYKLAQWSRADRSYAWEVSHAGRVIARCEKYGEAVAALAAHEANGVS